MYTKKVEKHCVPEKSDKKWSKDAQKTGIDRYTRILDIWLDFFSHWKLKPDKNVIIEDYNKEMWKSRSQKVFNMTKMNKELPPSTNKN